MTHHRTHHACFVSTLSAATLMALLFIAAPLRAEPAAPAPKRANVGERLDRDGVRILRLTGTPRERGFAHGARFAREIISLLDAFIKTSRLSGGAEMYEQNLNRIGRALSIEPHHREELIGLYEGVRVATSGQIEVPSLKRNLKLEDIIVMNAIADSARFGCSSFGAWGPMTATGDTIVARNLDWHYVPAMASEQIIIVHTPDAESGRPGWVSITWPGQIGCFTGMNEEGVTVAMHDVLTEAPGPQGTFTPRSLILREIIEKTRAATTWQDALDVLKRRTTAVGNNIPIGSPWRESATEAPFRVFEYDGRRSDNSGVQIHQIDRMKHAADTAKKALESKSAAYDLCTNHYRTRQSPVTCRRYKTLSDALNGRTNGDKPITPDDAAKLLNDVAVEPEDGGGPGLVTYHSVVFEPNRRLMRVAFCRGMIPATKGEWTSLNVEELIAGR